MKTIRFILIALVALIAASCSSTSYDAEKCKIILQKIENRDEITQEDYSTMIDQCKAIINTIHKKSKELGGDEKALTEAIISDTTLKEMALYGTNFSLFLEFNVADMDDSNKAKFEEFKKKIDEAK